LDQGIEKVMTAPLNAAGFKAVQTRKATARWICEID
jgi:hypothetical protein